MRAWDILVSNSTLQTGTAWEHLNNQLGDGQIVYVDRLNTIYGEQSIMLTPDYDVEVDVQDLEVEIEPNLVVVIEKEFRVKP
jgi:hypothetical protein